MRRFPRSLLLCWLALAIAFTSAARPALAAGDREKATRDFTEGVRLFSLGDFEGARAHFLSADAEVHAPPITFNLARAEEKLGDPQAAVDAYESYLREAGTSGELGLAASLAVAEIRERSARVVVDSRPSGALVEVDGRVARARTPMTMLVRPGRHRVRVIGEGIDEVRVVDVDAPGVETAIMIERALARSSEFQAEPATPSDPETSHWLAGAGAALFPYHFLGTPKSPAATRFADHTNVTLGIVIEGGIAIMPRLYVGGDLFASVGTYGHPNFLVGGGVGLSYRFDFGMWLRGAATIADVDSNKHGGPLSTDVVLGPSAEVSFEIARTRRAAWLVGVGACFLPADAVHDNDALFFPVRLGLRAF